jgi:hypothetical protein
MAFMAVQAVNQHFYAHGKLLISAEYFVLDGTPALAIPCKYGQHLSVESKPESKSINWTALRHDNSVWIDIAINSETLNALEPASQEALMISKLLKACRAQNPSFLADAGSYQITTKLEFPQNWGLGSSSTLVHLLAQWAAINPYKLLEDSFGGSGYDIAAAGMDKPFVYQRNGLQPIMAAVPFAPTFSSHLYFVHLNQKMNSREAIQYYRALGPDKSSISAELTAIGNAMISCGSLTQFMQLMDKHEMIVSTALKMETVKSRYFSDLNGAVKSLGAWGGDFVLLASQEDKETLTKYLHQKGYETIIPFDEMIYKVN